MASEVITAVLCGIQSEERREVERVLHEAYPSEEIRVLVPEDVTDAGIKIGLLTSDPRCVLVLLSDYYYRRLVPKLPDEIKLWKDGGVVLESVSLTETIDLLGERWLSREAWQKKVDEYYGIEPLPDDSLPFSIDDFNEALKTNAELRSRVEKYERETRAYSSLKSELAVVYKENERLKATQIQIGEYNQLELKYSSLNLENQRLGERLDAVNKELRDSLRTIASLKEERDTAEQAGYSRAVKELSGNEVITDGNVLSIIGKDAKATEFTDISLQINEKYRNVHVCFSATATGTRKGIDAVIKHITEMYDAGGGVNRDILLFDLSPECYTPLYIKSTTPAKVPGYKWLERPEPNLDSFKNRTSIKYIQTIYVNKGMPYNTVWLLTLPWNDILSNLSESGMDCYIYMGALGSTENRFIYESLHVFTDTLIFVEGNQPEIVVLYNILDKLMGVAPHNIYIYQRNPKLVPIYDKLKLKNAHINYVNTPKFDREGSGL